MKTQFSTLKRLDRNCSSSLIGLVSLILVFISHFGGCEAQIHPEPGVIVGIVAAVISVPICCCCCILCICCNGNCRYCNYIRIWPSISTRNTTHVATHSSPSQPAHSAEYYPQQRSTIPATSYEAESTSLQNVPQASEPVSLPEATLHQGDAPPAYEEAIGMKTVGIADLK